MKKIDVKNKILLFDLDGTLVDTEKVSVKVLFNDCVEKGLIDQEANLKKASQFVVGRTWKAAIRAVIQEFSLTSIDPVQWEQELKIQYQKELSAGVDLIPGVQQKLSEFKAKSRFMGIVTGSARVEVDLVLNAGGLKSYFELIWASEDYHESKPSPDPYLTAYQVIQQRFKSAVSKSDVLIFEDSLAGMASAHQAGFNFVQMCYAHPGMKHDRKALISVQTWNDLIIE